MRLLRQRIFLAGLLVTVGALAAVALAAARSTATTGPWRERDAALWSPALGGALHYTAFLPPGYERTRRRYPVVYVLHGLPGDGESYRGAAFIAQAMRAAHRKAIVITPQGARDDDSDPEYLDWGRGRNWETALTKELPAAIDARFRTIPSRAGRALVGFSAGGYGASILGLHHLSEFGVIESWSGYFHATDPSGHNALDVGSRADNEHASVHALVPKLRRAFRELPTYFAFYVGDEDFFRDENVRLHRELVQAHIPHTFRVYRGGHQRSLWQAQAPRWLDLALVHMAK